MRSSSAILPTEPQPATVPVTKPSRRIICVSYSGDLAKKHASDFRAILESPWYRTTFPTTRIGPYKNTETEIELAARGFRLATCVGGTLPGRGCDIIIIDDPLKPDDAFSESKRTGALYDGSGVVGGLGVSGDSSCADHNIAWRVRQALDLDKVPAGVGPDHNDEIIYDLAPDKTSASGYGYALCKGTESDIAEQIHAGFVPRWAKVTR